MTVREIIAALGGPAVVGRYLGLSSQAVSLWASKGVPAGRVPALVALGRELGVGVRAEDLRPDLDWAALRGAA